MRIAGVVLAVSLLAAMPAAGAPDPEPLPNSGDFVYVEILPEVIEKAAPVYPQLAREAGVEGTVMVHLLVDKTGVVRDVRVVKSIPMLDVAAVECVRRWRFKPALSNDRPIAVWVAAPVRFALDAEHGDSLGAGTLDGPVQRRPRSVHQPRPHHTPPVLTIACSERVAVVYWIAEVRLVDGFDSGHTQRLSQRLLGEAGLPADRCQPHVNERGHTILNEPVDEGATGEAFVPHAVDAASGVLHLFIVAHPLRLHQV